MKYGETLAQRSPPEWEAYNLDYNDIKRLIKDHTAGLPSAAIAIPGSGSSPPVHRTFEGQLYNEFANQHQRISLFVRSKAGEIHRRLDHLERIALQLQNHLQVAGRTKISVKRLEKFSKLESEVMKAGDQIQTLARYISAQSLGFKKLLKKYRKWSGSRNLDERFEKGIGAKANTFEKQDLQPLLIQYTELLTAVRAPFEAGLTWNAEDNDPPPESTEPLSQRLEIESRTASDLQRIFESGTNLEVDAALAALPFGPRAGHTSYWVHPDNLLQLHVMLLQYARLKVGNSVASTPRHASGHASPRESIDASAHMRFGTHEINGIIICDDLTSFAKGRSGVTIDQLEAGDGSHAEAAAASVRYAPSGECLVLVYPEHNDSAHGSCISMPSKYKAKTLRPLFDHQEATEDTGRRDSRGEEHFLGEDPKRVCKWLQEHRNIQPLAHLRYKRSRFVGLGNTRQAGMWATLDGDIQMQQASVNDLGLHELAANDTTFPHAVLEIRWEGRDVPEVVHLLNNSHLVERIPGFSLEVHAVYSVYEPSNMPRPHWIPILGRDIRKIPSNITPGRHRSSQIVSESNSDLRPSTATASAAETASSGGGSNSVTDSPATSVPEKPYVPPLVKSGKKHRVRRSNQKRNYAQYEPPKRYWNEFEDGEEAPENEAYTVLINPDTPTPFLDGFSTIKDRGVQGFKRLRKLLAPKKDDRGEREPLLPRDYFSIPRGGATSEEQASGGSDSSTATSPRRPSLPSRYSVFPSYHSISSPLDPLSTHTAEQRDRRLGRFAVVAFLASLVLLIAAGLVQLEWRNGTSISADIVVVFGIVASIVCAVAGVGLTVTRDDDAGWLGAAQMGLTFAVLCVGNGVLVVHLAAG